MTEKRVVPPALKALLRADIAVTTAFCHSVEAVFPPTRSRKYLKLFEISCHGMPWLSVWIAFLWILWNPELFEMQINFLFGLLFDMLVITLVKAATRRRRPPGNIPDMFMVYGTDVYSFPSGHVSRAVLISIFFSQLYPASGFIQFFLHIWAFAVGISRILLKRHYIGDVIGGAVIGFIEAGFLSFFWMNKSIAFWVVSWLTNESVTLEGLDDAALLDVD